jgi:hypothetical protein
MKKVDQLDPSLDEKTPNEQPAGVEVKPSELKHPVVATQTKVNTNDIVAATKAKLDAQEHITTHIPFADGEKPGAVETVSINGYRLTIPKGIMFSLPKDVVALLSEKYHINMTAGQEKRIDRANDVVQALL